MNPHPQTILYYPRPQILNELALDDHAVIEASAGTGKTYTMEHLVVDILLNPKTDTRLEEILVVTYTERATADLKKRIRSVLETIITAFEKPSPLQQLSPPEAPEDSQNHWKIDFEACKKLKRALFSFDVAPIHTIHGFCQRVLTENAFENHRLFDEEHVDQDRLFDEVFAETLRRDFAVDPDLIPYLNAWMQGKDNALKDLRNLLHACAHTRGQIQPSFNPEALTHAAQQLARFFTELDEAALSATFREQLKAQKTNGSTINAIIKRIPSFYEAFDNYAQNPTLPQLIAELEQLDLTYLRGHDEKIAASGPFGAALSQLLKHAVPLRAVIATLFTGIIKQRLRETKDTHGVFSFDDMLTHVWESLERPGSTLTEVLRRRYKYALIDEFQDTDEIQWQIFRRLFHESDRQNLLYVIGDPKQAIYAFRGADIFTYLRARQEILNKNGRLVRLDHNYRSTPDVIDGYNTIFDQNAASPFFTGAINYEHPVQCGKPDLTLHDASAPNDPPQPPVHLIQIQPPEGQSLTSITLRHGLARQYATEIHRLLHSRLEMHHPGEKPRPIQPRDIYVLTHRRSEGQLIGEYLRRAAVPCAFYKQDGLFQTPEARDIADLLTAIAHINDTAKRRQAWMTPFFNVPLTRLPALDDLPETHPLIQHMRSWHALAKARRFEELFARVTETSGLLRREIFFKDSERELTNYIHIFEILLEEATDQHLDLAELVLRLEAFIDETALPKGENGNVQRLESERNAVQIMTLHKSKGLEADIVFVFGGFTPGMARGYTEFHDAHDNPIFYIGPLSSEDQKRYETERTEEEQRLFYVALTRARARLYLPYIGRTNDKRDYPRLSGAYAGLNNRLDQIVAELTESTADNNLHKLFYLRPSAAAFGIPQSHNPSSDQLLAAWQPPATLLQEDPQSDPHPPRIFTHIRPERLKVSSYSAMKNLAGGYKNHLASRDLLTQNISSDDTDHNKPDALIALGKDALPGGNEAGKCLHAIIENLDFASVARHTDQQSFANDPQIHQVFTTQLRQYGLDTRYLPYTKRIIFQTLTTPISTPATPTPIHIPRIAACAPNIIELEFIFPIPETTHPALTRALQTLPADGFEIRRGYIKGFVDIVFQHHDRIYFADWKSDILDSYAPRALQQHIQNQYHIQAQLYSLAMVKMLQISSPEEYEQRFGGFFYLFLRGINAPQSPTTPTPGVFYQRLTWPEIIAYQNDLTQLAL